jgi:hypothetical protein
MTEEILRKLLLQLDCDKFPSTFDTITAYEAGVDHVLSYGEVTPEDVAGLLQGVMFTRPRADLRQTAVFIGGRRVDVCEEILRAAKSTMFDPYCLSMMLDSNGCNTASAAAVALIERTISVKEARVVILSGFGPVGLRAAKLLASEGARVLVTSLPREVFTHSWDEERARHDANLARQLGDEAGFETQSVDTRQEMLSMLKGAQAVLATGPSGVQLLGQSDWSRYPDLQLLADLNVAPPYGIEGVNPHWRGHEENGKVFFGGLGVGHLKMKVHKAAIMSLFEVEVVLDTAEIYTLAKTL